MKNTNCIVETAIMNKYSREKSHRIRLLNFHQAEATHQFKSFQSPQNSSLLLPEKQSTNQTHERKRPQSPDQNDSHK